MKRLPARCRWCSLPAGPASCCTKRWATAWKVISTASRLRLFPAASASRWHRPSARWWMTALLMGVRSTGNGRRESYAHLPMPRMTNTYMLPGKYSPEEIIATVDKGLYAVNFAGGQVDITNGKFVFSASEAYLIEHGKVTRPVKGATLIGSGPEAMTRISMVGNDLKLDSGIGVCGKDGQSVPVGVGQPTLKVDALTVGGTQA